MPKLSQSFLARVVSLLVFLLHAASCQNQDTNDVIVALDLEENNPSTEGLMSGLENVTSENDTDNLCGGFWSTDTGENLTWPEANAGSTVGVALQESICRAEVFRDCMEGGQWGEIHTVDPQECLADTVFKIIIFIGFAVSLIACVVAFVIFTMTRSSLRGLTHYQYHIHWNLITSFILFPVVMLVIVGVFKTTYGMTHLWLRNLLTVLLGYFVLANFFWMLVEGLVLFVLVATAFPGSQRGKAFVKWCLIGWGIPAVLVTTWIIVEYALTPKGSDFSLNVNETKPSNYGCLIIPVFLALVINGIVLVVVMKILWQKLRDDARNTTRYSSHERSSWRAAKSTFVILILLGVYYALPILVFSFEPPFIVQYVVSKISNIVNSLQGLAVCTLYVFCNAEVRRALRNCFRRFRAKTNLTFSTRLSSPNMSRSASPRHSKSHSSSEGSATKRPSNSGAEIEDAEMAEMAVLAEETAPQSRRQTCVVMDPLFEDPSECGLGEPGPAGV